MIYGTFRNVASPPDVCRHAGANNLYGRYMRAQPMPFAHATGCGLHDWSITSLLLCLRPSSSAALASEFAWRSNWGHAGSRAFKSTCRSCRERGDESMELLGRAQSIWGGGGDLTPLLVYQDLSLGACMVGVSK